MGYLRPTSAGVLSSWWTHRRRDPPSQEAGTDYGCAVGTPIHAAADGVVCDVGGSIDWATGLYLAIDLDDGRRVRYLHLWDRYRGVGDRVARGEIVAQSGASGYGSMWGAAGPDTVGQHVHTTLFPTHAYRFGADGTIDFEEYADESPPTSTGGGARGLLGRGWDEMASKDEIKDAMREVLNAARHGTAIIAYASDTFRNGIALVGPGYWHTFTSEEFEHVVQWSPGGGRPLFADVPVVTPVNDRHYDIIRDVMTLNDASKAPAVDVAGLAAALAALDRTLSPTELQSQVENVVSSNTLPTVPVRSVGDIPIEDVVDFSNSRIAPE